MANKATNETESRKKKSIRDNLISNLSKDLNDLSQLRKYEAEKKILNRTYSSSSHVSSNERQEEVQEQIDIEEVRKMEEDFRHILSDIKGLHGMMVTMKGLVDENKTIYSIDDTIETAEEAMEEAQDLLPKTITVETTKVMSEDPKINIDQNITDSAMEEAQDLKATTNIAPVELTEAICEDANVNINQNIIDSKHLENLFDLDEFKRMKDLFSMMDQMLQDQEKIVNFIDTNVLRANTRTEEGEDRLDDAVKLSQV